MFMHSFGRQSEAVHLYVHPPQCLRKGVLVQRRRAVPPNGGLCNGPHFPRPSAEPPPPRGSPTLIRNLTRMGDYGMDQGAGTPSVMASVVSYPAERVRTPLVPMAEGPLAGRRHPGPPPVPRGPRGGGEGIPLYLVFTREPPPPFSRDLYGCSKKTQHNPLLCE